MLERYFKHLLNERGFTNICSLRWSLEGNLEDEFSFTGDFGCNHLLIIARYMYPLDVASATLRVTNLMSRSSVSDFLEETDFSVSITFKENTVFDGCGMEATSNIFDGFVWDQDEYGIEFTRSILVYAKKVAEEIQLIGYKLQDSINRKEKVFWLFRTKKYHFQIVELAGDLNTTFFSSWDEVAFLDMCRSMRFGKIRFTSLRAELSHPTDTKEYASRKLISSTVLDGNHPSFTGFRKMIWLAKMVLRLLLQYSEKRQIHL